MSACISSVESKTKHDSENPSVHSDPKQSDPQRSDPHAFHSIGLVDLPLEVEIVSALAEKNSLVAIQSLLAKQDKEIEKIQKKSDHFKVDTHFKKIVYLKTIFILAVQKDNLAVAEFMLCSKQVPVESRDIYCGNTALMYACGLASPKMIDLLIKNKADLQAENTEFLTPIHQAVISGRIDNFRHLLTLDQNLWMQVSKSQMNCFLAAANGKRNQIELMKFLLTLDKDFWKKTRGDGHNAFMFALCTCPDNIELLRFLLTLNPDFCNQSRNDGNTPLFMAIARKNLKTIRFLVENGAGLGNIFQGRAEIRYAEELGSPEIVEYFRCTNKLWNAVLQGDLKQTKELISSGITIHLISNKGTNLLQLACKYQKYEVALFLLEQGAKHQDKNKEGNTFWDIVLKNGDVKFIIQAHKHFTQTRPDFAQSALKKQFTEIFEKAAQLELFEKAEKAGIFLDYDHLAEEYNPQFWVDFANQMSNWTISEDDMFSGKITKEIYQNYKQKNDKLSKIIYAGIIICKKNPDGSDCFEMPEAQSEARSKDTKEDAETKASKDFQTSLEIQSASDLQDASVAKETPAETVAKETPAQRKARLGAALKFATRAGSYADVLSIYCEITKPAIKLPELVAAKSKVQTVEDLLFQMTFEFEIEQSPKSEIESSADFTIETPSKPVHTAEKPSEGPSQRPKS